MPLFTAIIGVGVSANWTPSGFPTADDWIVATTAAATTHTLNGNTVADSLSASIAGGTYMIRANSSGSTARSLTLYGTGNDPLINIVQGSADSISFNTSTGYLSFENAMGVVIPEPSTALFIAIGTALLLLRRRYL